VTHQARRDEFACSGILFRGGDFVDDFQRSSARIGSGKNGASHDDEIRSRFDGVARSGGACLVILHARIGFVLGTNPRRDNQEFAPTRFTDGFGFLHRGNHAIDARCLRQLGQFDRARLRCAGDADFTNGFLVHAGQDGHGKQAGPVCAHGHACADGLNCRAEHGDSAEGVDVEQLNAGHSGRSEHRASDGVGNVMKFQVEENVRAELRDLPDGFGPGGSEQLAANFEHADYVRQLFGELDSGGQGIKIESDNQAAARMGVEAQGSGRARNIYFESATVRVCFDGTWRSSKRT